MCVCVCVRERERKAGEEEAQSKDFSCQGVIVSVYRGTSLIRNSALLGPYSRSMHVALWWVLGEGRQGSTRRFHPDKYL